MPLADMGDSLVIDEEVLRRVGKTHSEMRAMTLAQFHELVTSKGYDVVIGPWREAADGKGRLYIRMTDDPKLATA